MGALCCSHSGQLSRSDPNVTRPDPNLLFPARDNNNTPQNCSARPHLTGGGRILLPPSSPHGCAALPGLGVPSRAGEGWGSLWGRALGVRTLPACPAPSARPGPGRPSTTCSHSSCLVTEQLAASREPQHAELSPGTAGTALGTGEPRPPAPPLRPVPTVLSVPLSSG